MVNRLRSTWRLVTNKVLMRSTKGHVQFKVFTSELGEISESMLMRFKDDTSFRMGYHIQVWGQHAEGPRHVGELDW